MAPDYPAYGMPPMIGRMLTIPQWLDYVASYDFGTIPPTRVVLHHTWRPTLEQWAGLATMRGIQRYYASKGWRSAPHLFIGPDGIWLFTPMRDVGIHAGTGNSGYVGGRFWYSIGVEMVGNYDQTRPEGAVWEATKAVLGGLSRRLGIAPRQLISFHRDYTNQKSCPGWAVTTDWVFGEVEAWVNNRSAPPPPPPGPIGSPAPDVEALLELLLEQAYTRRAEGYNSDWAFHQYAVQNRLGFPIGPNRRVEVGTKSYAYQPFAADTLYNEIPNWGDVRRLSELLGGSIPPAGLGRVLLDATYRAGGATLHPEWAFHQYALSSCLGPPIGESARLTVDGVAYSFQVFALDTLYNRVPNWSEVQRLSELASVNDPQRVRLRDALLAQTYRRVGATYHADWAFHQLARAWNLGAPLSDSYRVASGATQYAIQVYATDVLYNVIPNWSDVKRVSQLVGPRAATLTGAVVAGPPISALLSAGAQLEPKTAAPYEVTWYRLPATSPTAYSDRYGAKIDLIVLHGDEGSVERTLPIMVSASARAMTHYYVTADARIYQLLDDSVAAWHAGMAVWEGRRRNINRTSLAIMVERGPEGYVAEQLDALAWLVDTLRARYQLPISAVVRWGELDPRRGEDPRDFPWEAFVRRLVLEVPVEG